MRGYTIELVDPQRIILEEIAEKRVPQRSVALTYAYCIRQDGKSDTIDWSTVNGAIVDRWSRSGLEAVKRRAWGLVEGKISP